MKDYLAVFAVFFTVFFLMLFFVPESIGNDGNYHIKMAQQTLENGIMHSFKWLKFTVLNENFVDLHFLFHVMLIPFVALFGLSWGLKISTAFFAGLFFCLFYFYLEKSDFKKPMLWIGILFFSSSFLIFRLYLGRAIVLGLIFLIAELYLIQKQNYWGIFLLSFIFTWSYIGFPMALIIAFLYCFAEFFFSREFDFKIVASSFFGIIAGLVINPFFPKNLSLLYTAFIQIPLLREFGNSEWAVSGTLSFLSQNFGIFALGLLFLYLLIEGKIVLSKNSKIFFFLTIVFFIFSLKIVRALEYFVPIALIFFASAFSDANLGKFNVFAMKKLNLFILLVLLFSSVALAVLQNSTVLSGTNETVSFKPCAEWLNANTPKDSTVFLWYYHYFPTLYYFDTHNTYTYGLDEYFGYAFDQNLFDKYKQIIESKKNLQDIPKLFDSNYIFIYKGDVSEADVNALKQNSLISTAIEAEKCIVFKFV